MLCPLSTTIYQLVSNMPELRAVTIRVARATVHESQEVFAQRFGVSRASVANWEQDKIGPPQEGPTRMLIDRVLAELEPAVQEPVK